MTISLSVFLFIFLAYLGLFLFFSFFNLYHMSRFGFVSFWAWFVTVAYIVLTILGLFVAYYYIAQIDWSSTVDIFQINNTWDY